MSKWIEENNDHILEGHDAKFVVGVLYSKQLPSKWTIKKSPFLLDVRKKFATLGEAKEYCEQRYQELFGKLDEITRLRADLAAVTEERDRMREALERIDGMATTICMRADAGYGMTVETVMPIYETARAAIEGVTEPASPWRDIESAPRDGTYIDLWANNERISDARWNDRQRRWEAWSLGDYDGMEFISIAGNPTHWMPLPEPPR